MRLSKDKKQIRYQMVMFALKHGIKPTARLYATEPKTVRKWLKRFKQGNYDALNDLSRRPKHSPRSVLIATVELIVKLKAKYKRLGAEQIKILENLSVSAKTIRKIWRNNGVATRQRRKKHLTKQDLRAVKKQFALFQRSCEDTKDLCDIPEYRPQMMQRKLPKVQYTFREVSCGIQFIGFADERSITHSSLFANYINEHLKKFNLLSKGNIRQTDNGSEYIGSWQAKKPSAYTLTLEKDKLLHTTIPCGAHRWQSDIETVHNLIEVEFYEIETFKDRKDFMQKALTYQTFFNFQRPNSYKENRTPWQLVQQKRPDIPKEALMLPPVDLDALLYKKLDSVTQRGYDVYSGPSLNKTKIIPPIKRLNFFYGVKGQTKYMPK